MRTLTMIQGIVKLIREQYDPNVPIIVRMDSGFRDQKLFKAMEDLEIGYIVGGVFHPDVQSLLGTLPDKTFKLHFGKKEEDIWELFRAASEYGKNRTPRLDMTANAEEHLIDGPCVSLESPLT